VYGSLASFSEDGNKPSGSKKSEELPEELSELSAGFCSMGSVIQKCSQTGHDDEQQTLYSHVTVTVKPRRTQVRL
jgi:hypothetical protein